MSERRPLAVVLAPSPAPVGRDAGWLRAAGWARWPAWGSLAWMTVDGAVGLTAGRGAGSIALVGWALSSGSCRPSPAWS